MRLLEKLGSWHYRAKRKQKSLKMFNKVLKSTAHIQDTND